MEATPVFVRAGRAVSAFHVIQPCCGSYEAYFAELEPQYAVEHSETAFLR